MTHSTFTSSIAAALVLAGFAGAAHAQSAGSWLIRGGFTQIVPQVGSRDLSAPSLAGTKVGVGPTSRPGGGITYMATDHIAIDLPLNTPYKHELVGAGAIAGAGKIGDVKSAPVTLLAQWRFLAPDAMLRPYIGAGVTYAKFYKARTTAVLSGLTGGSPSNPTTLHVDSKLAPTVQIGGTYAFAPRWFLDASVAKTIVTTTSHLSTGQSIETRLNPTSMTVGVGYRF
jgi:outer membrane protein